MAALLGLPLAVLVVRSLTPPSGFGLRATTARSATCARAARSSSPPADAIWNSVRYALVATVIAVVVGGLAAWAGTRTRSRWLDGVLALPLGVSAVTLGFGFLIALDEPPLDLRGSQWLVPLAQALVALPFVVLLTAPVLRAIDPRLREAAADARREPRRVPDARSTSRSPVARCSWPARSRSRSRSGEFGATAFVVRPDSPTLPIVIYRLLGQPGDVSFGGAMAASVLLMVLVVVAMIVGDRMRAGRVGEF